VKPWRIRTKFQNENGDPLSIFGHVRCEQLGSGRPLFSDSDSNGSISNSGALTYNAPRLLGGPLATGMRFCFEALLDALPKSWVRPLSDQMIGLYTRAAARS